MARQITIAFAENGNRDSIPVTVQLNGEVSWAEGYGFDYQRPIGSSPLAKNVERTKQNALFHDITEILRQYQQQGAPEWYADTPYAQFARVKHEGNYYVALVDATEQEPGTGGDWTVDNVAAQARQNNLTATTDPTVNNDETEGYEPLSQWINTSSGEVFVAISVAAGAADWQQGTLSIDELGNVALLNANAIGQSIIQSPNPSAVRFMRANADNSVSWLSTEDFRTALSLTNTDGLPEGSTNQYFTQVRVRSSTLTGFAAGVGFTAVIATDTIIQALQKIQGWLSSLGTASQANLVASNTDTTAGSVTTTGWLGNGRTLEYKSQATDDLNDFNVAGAHGMWGGSSLNRPTNNVYIVHVLGGSTSSVGGQIPNRLVQLAYRVGSTESYSRSYNGTSWSSWTEEWNTGNLVKTTSAADTTAGSVPTVGWMNLGNTEQQPGGSYDWATSPTRFMSTNVNGPESVGTNFIRGIHVLIGTAGFNIGGREGRAWFQTLGYAGEQGDWKELWHSGNLTLTTGPTDTTAGSVVTTEWQGLGSVSGAQNINSLATGSAVSAVRNSFVRSEGNTGDFPVAYGIPFSASGVKFSYNSSRGSFLFTSIGGAPRGGFVSSSSDNTYNQFAEWWTTGNTSADVQAMLGAANNEAIRSSIGTAKKLAVANVSTADHFVTAGNESVYHRFTFNGAKTATVRPNSTHALPADGSWVLRNVGTGNLTIVEGSGVTINPPYGGTLVLEPRMTVTLQKVGTNEYDLIGQTVPA